MRCGEDHEVGCGPCGRAVQAEPLVVNPGNTAWRFGHCTFKTPSFRVVHYDKRDDYSFKVISYPFLDVMSHIIIFPLKIMGSLFHSYSSFYQYKYHIN